MKAYHYTFLGEDYTLGFFFDRYTFNGNLYVGLVNLGNEDDPYFADLTINIMLLLPYVATIDDHLDSNICKWLESIGAGRTYDYKIPCTTVSIQSSSSTRSSCVKQIQRATPNLQIRRHDYEL